MGGMTLVSLLCSFFTILSVFMRNKKVFVFSFNLTIALFIVMHCFPELRKKEPWNHWLLLALSICMIVFYGSFTGVLPVAPIVTFIMAVSCAVLGLYFGACLAKTSTNREYLIRKLFLGALAGFLTCILLMVYAMYAFKFNAKSPVFIWTMIIYLLAVAYLGYVVVFVILPGHAENKDDIIWGVITMYTHIAFIVLTLLFIITECVKKCKGEDKERPRR